MRNFIMIKWVCNADKQPTVCHSLATLPRHSSSVIISTDTSELRASGSSIWMQISNQRHTQSADNPVGSHLRVSVFIQ